MIKMMIRSMYLSKSNITRRLVDGLLVIVCGVLRRTCGISKAPGSLFNSEANVTPFCETTNECSLHHYRCRWRCVKWRFASELRALLRSALREDFSSKNIDVFIFPPYHKIRCVDYGHFIFWSTLEAGSMCNPELGVNSKRIVKSQVQNVDCLYMFALRYI